EDRLEGARRRRGDPREQGEGRDRSDSHGPEDKLDLAFLNAGGLPGNRTLPQHRDLQGTARNERGRLHQGQEPFDVHLGGGRRRGRRRRGPDLPAGRLRRRRGMQGGDRRRALARGQGDPLTAGPPEEDPRKTPFVLMLVYVLGFMAALALLAYAAAWLLRHH